MIKDISIGQYYPANSPIHSLDPRSKINIVFLYMISLFISNKLTIYLISLIVLMGVIKLSKVPFKYIIRGLKPVIILIILTVVLNIFLTPGERIWASLPISYQGVLVAARISIRLLLLIMGSTMLTLTTSPISITDGIERLLRPFEKIKLPAHEIAMMMSIALGYIPILVEETDKIMKAQMARGADFESGNIFRRAKNMLPLLVPLFISAFRRAYDLALAMESRCYKGGEGRTKMNQLQYGKSDRISYLLAFSYLVLVIALDIILKDFY